MVFFPKNKRGFAYRSQRRVFVALFLFALVFSSVISLLVNTRAESGPIASVDFYSQHADFDNIDPGAWRVTKTAEWTDTGKAKITFDVASRNKLASNKPKDIVFVIDNSWSMEGPRLDLARSQAINLTDTLLDDNNNQIALISFSDAGNILSDFTNDKETIRHAIRGIEADNNTNYLAAIQTIEQLLDRNTLSNERELIILLLTDGLPQMETPNEVTEYVILKSLYPQATVNGILYEFDGDIPQELKNVSDYQYVADTQTLYNILLDAVMISSAYTNFSITDYINDTYWTIGDENDIEVDKGSASLSYDGATPIITWNMEGTYRSGSTARMTIEVNLKDEYLDTVDLLLPTNRRTVVNSTLVGNNDENVDENETPILKDAYQVSYDANAPSECAVAGTIPETTHHSVYSRVEISDNQLTCEGYSFKGWKADTGVAYINDEYFKMPAKNIVMKARWSKLSISKSMEGEINTRAEATFDYGDTINVKMRHLSGEEGEISPYVNRQWNEAITGFVRSDSLSNMVDIDDDRYIFSSPDSDLPIYGWYNDGIIYWYTDADDVYLNEDANGMFKALNNLADIESFKYFDITRTRSLQALLTATDTKITNLEPLRYWDVSNVTDFSAMLSFRDDSSLTDYSAIDGWDTSSATSMAWMLSGYPGTDLTEFSGWVVDNVTDMSGMFLGARNLTSLTGVEEWDTGNVTKMTYMFEDAIDNVADLKPLKDWDTSNVTDMAYMFYSDAGGYYEREKNYGPSDISDLGGWDVSKVVYMDYMFYGLNNVTDITALGAWETSSLEETPLMFYLNDLHSLEPLGNWNMSKVKYIAYMFYGNENITTAAGLEEWNTMTNLIAIEGLFSMNTNLADISAISDWDVSKAVSFRNLFYGTKKLLNVDVLGEWVTSSVINMDYMFASSGITSLGSTEEGNETGMAKWDVSKVTTMNSMFAGADYLTGISALSDWVTTSLTDVSYMFDDADRLPNINALSNWDMSKVTSMTHMFCTAYALNDISGAANWVLTNLEDASYMFRYTKITNLDALANWNAPKLKKMMYMFQSLTKLTDISGLNGEHWNTNTANVESLEGLFYNSTSITNVDALANWNIGKVTSIYAAFRGMTSLADVNGLASWNVSKASNLSYIFYGDTALTDISGLSSWYNDATTSNLLYLSYSFDSTGLTDLSALANWKTPKLTTMNYTFNNMLSLESIEGLRNWDTAKVTSINYLLAGDAAITDLEPIYDWNTAILTSKTSAFDGIPDEVARPDWYTN